MLTATINVYQSQGGNWGDQIYLSGNSGASWTNVVARTGFLKSTADVTWGSDVSIHWPGTVNFDPFNPKAVWVTSGFGVFTNANIDSTYSPWVFTVHGMEETVPLDAVSLGKPGLLTAIGDFDGFLHTSMTAYPKRYAPSMGTTSAVAVAANRPNVVYRVGNSMYVSTDTARTWRQVGSTKGTQGRLAVAADGSVVLHCPANAYGCYRSTDSGNSWSSVNGLSVQNAAPVADPVNRCKFYASGNNAFYVSTDGGASFTATTTALTGASQYNYARAPLYREGDVWVPLGASGLTRSTDSGKSFTAISGVTSSTAVGFGKKKNGASYVTVFIWGVVNGGEEGIYRSTDAGASWVRVNDAAHQFGGLGNGNFVIGDMGKFGRVYVSTSGRGLIYGHPTVQ